MQKPSPPDAYARSLLARTRLLEKSPYTHVLAERIQLRCQLQLALAREAGSTQFDHFSAQLLKGDLVIAVKTPEHSTSPHGPLRRNLVISFFSTRFSQARLLLGLASMGPALFCNRMAQAILRSIALEEARAIYACDPASSLCPAQPPNAYARHLQRHLCALASRAHGSRVTSLCSELLDATRAAGISYLKIEGSSCHENNDHIEISASSRSAAAASASSGPLAPHSAPLFYVRAVIKIFPHGQPILRWANRFSLAILGQDRFALLIANRLIRSLAVDEAEALHRARLPLPPGVIAYSERLSLLEMTRSAAPPAHKARRL